MIGLYRRFYNITPEIKTSMARSVQCTVLLTLLNEQITLTGLHCKGLQVPYRHTLLPFFQSSTQWAMFEFHWESRETGIPGKREIPGNGKSRKISGNPGKSREIPGNLGKSRKILGNPGKSREISGNLGKPGEITGNPGKSREILGNGKYFLLY